MQTNSIKTNQINFLFHAENLLVEQFGDRLIMSDLVEKAVLLDSAIQSLAQAGFLSDVVLKGGGALQRAYFSHRFSSDLDFACGKIPPFTPQQFQEYGNDFFSYFTSIIQKDYGIDKNNIKSNLSEMTLKSDVRRVNKWIIEVKIPDSLSLLSSTQREIARSRRLSMKDVHKDDIQTIKIEICNVPSYIKKCVPLYPSSAYNKIVTNTNTEDLEEIFYEKAAAVLTRKNFKYHDIFDMLFAEYFSNINNIDSELFKRKIYDQMMKKHDIYLNINNNLKKVVPYINNTNSFKEAMGLSLTLIGYQAIFNSTKEILEYGYDRCQRFSAVLHGKSWNEPWNNDMPPISIELVATSLKRMYENIDSENDANEKETKNDDVDENKNSLTINPKL